MSKKKITDLFHQLVDFYTRVKNYDLSVNRAGKEKVMSKKTMQVPSFMSKGNKKFEGYMNPPIEEEDIDEVEELEEIEEEETGAGVEAETEDWWNEEEWNDEVEEAEVEEKYKTSANILKGGQFITKKEHKEEKHAPIKYPTEYMTDLAKGMTRDELETIANEMPIELCFNRIGKEIQKAQNLAKNMQRALDAFNGVL